MNTTATSAPETSIEGTVRALMAHVYRNGRRSNGEVGLDIKAALAKSNDPRCITLRFMPSLVHLDGLPKAVAGGVEPLALLRLPPLIDMDDEAIWHNVGVFHEGHVALLQIHHDPNNPLGVTDCNAEWRLTDYGTDRIALGNRMKELCDAIHQLHHNAMEDVCWTLQQIQGIADGVE